MTGRPERGQADGVIGRSIPRPNARGPAGGRGRYVGDVAFARLLEVAFVRSPHAHARIAAIDSAAAERLPGVVRVLAGAELADRTSPWQGLAANLPTLRSVPQYGLAVERARWQGEPVVAIAARSRAVAEDAAELVRIDWEPLPVLADVETALDDGAPVLHPELGDNTLFERAVDNGAVDQAFAAAHTVVEASFRFGRHTGVTLEARVLVADFDPAGGMLTLHYGGQAPHMSQVLFARHLGLEEQKVRVIAHEVGGSYGIKSHFYGDELAVAALSVITGRPVRYFADRLESFVSDIHFRDHAVRARMALDAQGRITGLDVDDLIGAGAYSAYPRTSALEANQVLNLTGGPYRIANYRNRARVVFQNKVPIAQYRGVGHPIAAMVAEGLIEKAARALEIDIFDIRRRNFHPCDGDPSTTPSGIGLVDLSYNACLDRLRALMDYDALCADQAARRNDGIWRGIGIAAFIKTTNPPVQAYGPAGAPISAQDGTTVRLEPSGAITCLTGVTEQGQGTDTVLAQIAAETLGVPFESVRVVNGDTDSAPYGGGTYGSRGVGIGGEATRLAAAALNEEIRALAGSLLQRQAADLEIAGGVIRERSDGTARMTLAELGQIAFFRSFELPEGVYPALTQTRRFMVRENVFTNGVHGAHVELDSEIGTIRVLGYWAVDDVGVRINPLLVDEQARGAIVQGFGDALYEHTLYDDAGQLLNGTMVDYLVPMAAELPDIVLDHVETPSSHSGLGAKGAGESGTAGAPATIFNAVNDALAPSGAAVAALPITPEAVLAALGRV